MRIKNRLRRRIKFNCELTEAGWFRTRYPAIGNPKTFLIETIHDDWVCWASISFYRPPLDDWPTLLRIEWRRNRSNFNIRNNWTPNECMVCAKTSGNGENRIVGCKVHLISEEPTKVPYCRKSYQTLACRNTIFHNDLLIRYFRTRSYRDSIWWMRVFFWVNRVK